MRRHAVADELHCTFCNKPRGQVPKLIAGPNVYICNECIGLCVEIIESDPERQPDPPAERELHCSFCNKPRSQVSHIIAGPNVFICSECIKLCVEILGEDPKVGRPTTEP